MNEIETLIEQKRVMIAALDAVLLFHSGGLWDEAKGNRWTQLMEITMGIRNERINPSDKATTKNLCDAVRAALVQAGINPEIIP